MKLKLLTLSALIALISPFAHAKEGVGNGGYVLICKKAGKTTTLTYDYYEGQKRADNVARDKGLAKSDFALDLGRPGLTHMQMIEHVLKRLSQFDGTRARRYLDWAKSFMSESEPVEKLGVIADTGVVDVPAGCELKLAVGQKDESQFFEGDKRYSRVTSVWNLLDEKTKAGIILHEVIYREAIENGHASSAPARYFNALISSNQLNKLSPEQYRAVIKKIKFKAMPLGNIIIDLTKPFEFHSNGEVKSATLLEGSALRVFDQTLKVEGPATFDENGNVLTARVLNPLYVDMIGARFALKGDLIFHRYEYSRSSFVTVSTNHEKVEENEGLSQVFWNGKWYRLSGAVLYQEEPHSFWSRYEKMPFRISNKVYLSNGINYRLKTISISAEPVQKNILGQSVKVRYVSFTEDWLLHRVRLVEPINVSIPGIDSPIESVAYNRQGEVTHLLSEKTCFEVDLKSKQVLRKSEAHAMGRGDCSHPWM